MTNKEFGVGITGVGKYIPKRLMTTAEVAKRCNTDIQWILDRTGIQTRYFVENGDTASGISASAAEQAMEQAAIGPGDLDLIIGCTFSGDYRFPAMAVKVQDLLGARKAGAFDVLANCTGFQVGITLAADRVRCDPMIHHVLVLGTAVQSPFLNWIDPETSMFFGDGAGAAIVSRVPAGYGLLSTQLNCNGRVYDAVRLRGGGSSHPLTAENINEGLQYYEMDGMETWKQLVQHQPVVIEQALSKAGLSVADVDMFIFHQANLKLIQYLMGKMKLPMSKTYTNVERLGNTADASLALALCEAVEAGNIKHDNIVVISGVGAGYIFGASVLKWY